jgi:hypothetical protein
MSFILTFVSRALPVTPSLQTVHTPMYPYTPFDVFFCTLETFTVF